MNFSFRFFLNTLKSCVSRTPKALASPRPAGVKSLTRMTKSEKKNQKEKGRKAYAFGLLYWLLLKDDKVGWDSMHESTSKSLLCGCPSQYHRTISGVFWTTSKYRPPKPKIAAESPTITFFKRMISPYPWRLDATGLRMQILMD